MNFTAQCKKDRLAVALTTAALLLLCVFFYALRQNVAGLGREIEDLKNLNQAVLSLNERQITLDSKVTKLETLPGQTTKMAMEQQVRAMAHAAADLDQRLDGKQREKLAVVKALLEEIGTDLQEGK